PYSTPAETKPVTEQADLLCHEPNPPRRSERWGIDFEVVVPVHLVAGVPGIPGIGGARADSPAGLRFAGDAASSRALGRPFCASRPFCAGRSFRAGRGSAPTACAFSEFRDIAVPGQLLHR